MKWPKQVACIEENRNAYNIMVGKPEGNRLLVQLGMDGNMLKMILKETGSKGMDRIHRAQDTDQW